MANLETSVAKLETEMQFVRSDVTDLKQVMTDFIDRADTKFASKLTEKIVYGLVGLITSSVVIALIYLVVNK